MTPDEIYNCTHKKLTGPTPAMMEDGDWRGVCTDCLKAVRMAICDYARMHGRPTAYGQVLPFAKNPVASTDRLAFRRLRPDEEFDTYYCGCRGWD